MDQWSRIHLPVQETWVQTLGQEDLLEQEKATHFSILAWAIPWTVEPGGLQSMGFSQKEYWSGLPLPSPGALSRPGIEPMSPALAGGFFTTEPQWQPPYIYLSAIYWS